jgi:hypothetical protein
LLSKVLNIYSYHFLLHMLNILLLNLYPPTNIKDIFGSWLNGIDEHTQARVLICVSNL